MAGLALAVDILAKDRASGTLRKLGGEAEKTHHKFAALAGGIAGGALGASLAGVFKSGIQGASDLSETLSKTRNIFGEQSSAVEEWSKGSAKAFGLSRQAALGAASQYGDMFKQLGFTGDAAVKASTGLVKTAADLGSFHNVDPSDVLDRIGGALRGEYDSLQQLIPNINAARVEQEALATTHKKSAKDLSAAEKATAVLAIIQKDGAKAANDFAETSGGLANQQRILSAQFKDVTAQVATALLPVLVKAASVLASVANFVQRNIKVIGPLVTVVGTMAATFFLVNKAMAAGAAVKAAYIALTGAQAVATEAATGAQVGLNGALLANPIGLVVVAIAGLVAGLVYAYKHSEKFRNIVNAAFDAIKTGALAMRDVAVGAFRFLFNVYTGIIGGIIQGAAKAFGWVPGIGPKLKAASSEFNAFRDRVNDSLAGINETKTITIKAVSSTAAQAFANAGIASGALSGSEAAASVTTRAGSRAIRGAAPQVAVTVHNTVDKRGITSTVTQQTRKNIANGATPSFG